jgi:hypothetical protein
MAVLLWLPAILFGAVLLIVGGVSAAVEIAAWRRVRRIARRRARRRGFRPVVIQGGRPDPGRAPETLAG